MVPLIKNTGKMEPTNLHEVLRSVYEEMMPMCADMAAVAKGVAGLGALFYVAVKGLAGIRSSRTD